MGITPAMIGGAVTGGSALAGLLGLGNNTPQAPPPAYMPQSLGAADSGAINGIGALGTTIGGATTSANNIANNPYAPSYQANVGQIGQAGMAGGANIYGAAQSTLPYAQQALQTAYDPQNALYAQQYQANNDAVNASLASRGLATTPYGAGVQSTSDQQFNTNWLQTQLQRQATGAQTASSILNTAGTGTTTGLNQMTAGAALPYSTANTINQNGLNAYGTLAGIQNPQIADYLQYLGLGNQSAGVNNQNYANQITAQNNQFNQMQTLGKNLGSGISAFGGSSGAVAPYSTAGNPVTYQNYGGITYPQYT
jgi:hypothetical protein